MVKNKARRCHACKEPKKNKPTSYFNPNPGTNIQKKGSVLTAHHGGKRFTHDASHFKQISGMLAGMFAGLCLCEAPESIKYSTLGDASATEHTIMRQEETVMCKCVKCAQRAIIMPRMCLELF